MSFVLFLLRWICSYAEIMTSRFKKVLVFCHSQQKTGFDPRPVHVEIVVYNYHRSRFSSEYFGVSPSSESSKFSAFIHAASPKLHLSNWQRSEITKLKMFHSVQFFLLRVKKIILFKPHIWTHFRIVIAYGILLYFCENNVSKCVCSVFL
jgi:hypothetical protein